MMRRHCAPGAPRRWRRSCDSRCRPASISPTTASSARRPNTGSISAPGGVTSTHVRWGGLRAGGDMMRAQPRRSEPGKVVLTSFSDRRDRQMFAAAYADPESGVSTAPRGAGGGMVLPVCVAPITYTGQEIIAADIAHARAALDAAGVSEGFITAIAPGSCGRIPNEYYASEEALMFACAAAMRVEYQAIINAGFVLQLDDPALATSWDMINPE